MTSTAGGHPRWRSPAAAAVGVATVLVVGCAAAGWWLAHHGRRLHLGTTYPVTGRYQVHLTAWVLLPVAVAVVVWRAGPRIADRLSWTGLLVASYVVAAVWAVTLALVGGPAAVTAPLAVPAEYPHDVGRVGDVGTFLRTFVQHVADPTHGPQWTTHVAGHPPLAMLIFVLLHRIGLGPLGWAAAMCVLAGAAVAPAVLSTTRLMAGERWARAAVPFVAAAPVALWVATSADAVFAAVAAGGVCALAHAAARTGLASSMFAATGGLALGCCLFLSYGLVLLAPVAVAAVAAARRSGQSPPAAGVWWRTVPIAAATAALVVAVFAAAGFWWLDGFAAASLRVADGVAHRDRPWGYFLLANPAAVTVALGPAVIAALPALGRLRRPRPSPGDSRSTVPVDREHRTPGLLLVAVAAVAAMAVATVSGLSKGEVERIYLPWLVWLLPLAAALPRATRHRWLAAQLGWALTLATTTTLSW